MAATTIELSIEDGVCVARRVLSPVNEHGSIMPPKTALELMSSMTDQELDELVKKFPAVNQIRIDISQSRAILKRFPDAEMFNYCDGVCGYPSGGSCIHRGALARSHFYLSYDNVARFLGDFRICKKCSGGIAIGHSGRDGFLTRPSVGPAHIHAVVRGETGNQNATLYLYQADTYIAAKNANVPADVLSLIRDSPANLHHIASPEVINGASIINAQRVRDPLLFASWTNRRGLLIHQWE